MSNSAIAWTAAHQDSLSITNFWSLFRLISIELVMSSNHLISCLPLLPDFNLSQHQDLFHWLSSSVLSSVPLHAIDISHFLFLYHCLGQLLVSRKSFLLDFPIYWHIIIDSSILWVFVSLWYQFHFWLRLSESPVFFSWLVLLKFAY